MYTSLYSCEYLFHELWFLHMLSANWNDSSFLTFSAFSLSFLSDSSVWDFQMNQSDENRGSCHRPPLCCDGSCLLFLCMLYHVHVISFYFSCRDFFFLKWHGVWQNVFFCLHLHWGHWRKIFYSCVCLALVSGRVYNWGNFGLFFSVESSWLAPPTC